MAQRLTKEQIENRVESRMNALDKVFLNSPMTQERYDALVRTIENDIWQITEESES